MGLLFHLVVLIAAIGAFTAAHGAMSVEASFASGTAVVVVLSIAGELLLGRKEPAATWADARRDLGYTAITAAASGAFSASVAFVAIHAADSNGAALWPSGWPFIGQALAAVLMADFGSYWMHRLIHRSELLYRFHEVHHSSTVLYWLNANRFHPIDTLIFQLAATAPLVLLGAPEIVIALAALVGQTGTFLQHSRVPVDGGWWNRLLHTSLAHRLHHREDACAVRNFGGTLLLWDWLFGTHEAPVSSERPRLGTGRAYPVELWKQLIEPLRGRRER
jgi:sterol desaturase/sphingolipid hydroxylase (fatty acid hydroxylase superfamily)